RALQVVAGHLRTAGHLAGEAVRVAAEQHAVGGRRRLGEEGQPADAVVVARDPGPLRRDGRPAHPAGAVAAGDEVTDHDLPPAAAGAEVGHRGTVAVQAAQPYVAHAEPY